MSDPCDGYSTRRSWLLAEAIAGFVAISIGQIAIAPNGRVAAALAKTGDTYIWLYLFTAFGAAMVLTAGAETVLRRTRQCPLGSWCYRAFAWGRELEHICLGACYLYALAIAASTDTVLVLIPLQSVVFLIVHIRGAWEHAKALEFGRWAGPYPTVVGFIWARFRGRDYPSR